MLDLVRQCNYLMAVLMSYYIAKQAAVGRSLSPVGCFALVVLTLASLAFALLPNPNPNPKARWTVSNNPMHVFSAHTKVIGSVQREACWLRAERDPLALHRERPFGSAHFSSSIVGFEWP